ncbi:MAG: hypothetical protein H6712_13175 [Myxococcales bacterium]|nr:hypothetical protein [Myxococcales bacterium]
MRCRPLVALAIALAACARAQAPAPEPAPVSERPTVRVPEPSPSPAPAAPEPAPEPIAIEGYEEVAELLAERWIGWWEGEHRMAVARRGPVRFRSDGVEQGLADRELLPGPRRLMVLEDEERPRVVVDEPGVRLLLHVERADAQPVMLARVPLRPEPGFVFLDPPQRGHVVVDLGTWVEALAEEGEATQVRWRGHEVEWTGWVDTQVLGTSVARPEDRSDDDEDAGPELVTKRTTALRERPGKGKTLVTLDDDEFVRAVTKKASRGHRLVEYTRPCEDDVSYVGFVAARDLEVPDFGAGYGCGSGSPGYSRPWGAAESAPRVTIEAGRVLLEPEGPPRVIGCVRESVEMAELGGGVHAVATMWGPILVRLAPEGFGGPCGSKQ